MFPPIKVHLPDLQSTDDFARALAHDIPVPLTIALNGTLGAGKTQWTRFFCCALGVLPEVVTSPTYVLLQRYLGNNIAIFHCDYYRLENDQQVWDLGIDEMQESPVLMIIEWANKFPQTLPLDRLDLEFTEASDGSRMAMLQPTGPATAAWLASLSLKPIAQ